MTGSKVGGEGGRVKYPVREEGSPNRSQRSVQFRLQSESVQSVVSMVSARLVLVAVAAFVAVCTAAEGEDPAALAPVLNKKYKLASSENFEEVMKELGVGWITRKLGNAASPVIELTNNNGEYSLTSKSTFKDTDLRFRIGQEFNEETPDGRTVKSIITQKGNVLTHTQKGDKTTTIVRTFSPEEIKMVVKVGDIVSTRIYKPE